MPIATRPTRALVAACLVVATLLSALPAPAAALEPPRPLPDYRARFVTQTDRRPVTNCLWASGAMLLDKWTNGEVRVSHQALRAKSGDRVGGSSFDELKVAYARYGFRLKFSPDGGARITWGQLLSRLGKGAGAVLLGDYSKLPRYYGRWDYKFWKKKGKKDNHAVYVERYDRARGRVWLMDPLARGDWRGEWISTRALRRFAWSAGGYMYAAMTPTAKAAPFAKVKATTPQLAVSSSRIDASWTLKAPKSWKFPGADARTVFKPAADPLLAAVRSPGQPVKATGIEPATEGKVWVRGKRLHLSTPLPTKPGAYVARLSVQDRRFGRSFVQADPLAVFVPGGRRATLQLNASRRSIEAGTTLRLSVDVANSGIQTWEDTRVSAAGGTAEAISRATRVEVRWIRLDAPTSGGDPSELDAAALMSASETLGFVPLAPHDRTKVRGWVLVPAEPGRWALAVDVVDDVEGSFAALGSAPAWTTIDVVAPQAPGSAS